MRINKFKFVQWDLMNDTYKDMCRILCCRPKSPSVKTIEEISKYLLSKMIEKSKSEAGFYRYFKRMGTVDFYFGDKNVIQIIKNKIPEYTVKSSFRNEFWEDCEF